MQIAGWERVYNATLRLGRETLSVLTFNWMVTFRSFLNNQMSSPMFGLLLALLFVGAHSQGNYAVFAFSWYEGHCISIANTGGCDSDKVDLWDHQSFTIHGLWPQTTTTKDYGAFDFSIIREDSALLDDMNNYWPPQSRSTGSPTFLWAHEWEDHGHDYVDIINRLQPNRFKGLTGAKLNRALQSAYFHDVVAFYKSYPGAKKYPSSSVTKQEWGAAFGVKSDQFTFSCTEGTLIREVKICFDITPTGPKVKTCTNLANTQCKRVAEFELPGWSQSRQKRVVAYPNW